MSASTAHTGVVTNPLGKTMVLSIQDEDVMQLAFDYAFTIVMSISTIRIESSFRLTVDGIQTVIDPEKPERVSNLVELHQTAVTGECFENGTLELRFSNGSTIDVFADPHYEAWSVTRGDGEQIIALPGGGLTRYGPRP
jgi:hypothetical protein